MDGDFTEIEYTGSEFTEIDYTESEDNANEKQILIIRIKHLLPDTDNRLELRIHYLPSADGLLVKI